MHLCILYTLIFGCRFALRQYEQTEFKQCFSVTSPDNTVDGPPSLPKLEPVANVPTTKALSSKPKRQLKEDDFKDTVFTGSKGRVVIF